MSEREQNVGIHDAASIGVVHKVSDFLNKEPSLMESRDGNGMTPLLIAARDGQPKVVTLLINMGANLKATSTMGNYNAIALAAKNGQKDVVEILLNSGCDANLKSSDGNTPIMLVQSTKQTEVLALFKTHGYTINTSRPSTSDLNYNVVQLPIAEKDILWLSESFIVSPNDRRVAWGARAGYKYWTVVDGKLQKALRRHH